MKNDAGETVKLSVFVGSPKRDLEDVRLAIIQAVLECGHIPDGMELWAADPRPTQQAIAEKLQMCDVHVVVLGATYGSLVDSGISFTEWEYWQSKAAKRPIIAFMLEENAYKTAWEQAEVTLTVEEQLAYLNFREELRKNRICKMYQTTEMTTIIGDVKQALNEILDSRALGKTAGWIRAESKVARLANALQGNSYLLRIMERVVGFQTTGGRFETEKRAKRAAAETFWGAMLNELERRSYCDLFIDSGSSLGYVSEVFEELREHNQTFSIATNNALALFQLLLFTDGEIHRNPHVAPDPDDPYGAIFTHKSIEAFEEPPIKPRKLFNKELEAIEELVSMLKHGRSRRMILATASGWDTVHTVPAFQGPHVGSHANMLFKRAIFMTGHPIVMFLSRRKLDPKCLESRFKRRTDDDQESGESRYCYPVFGKELTMNDALSSVPFAFCIGYELEDGQSEYHDVEELLRKTLLNHINQADFDMEYAGRRFRDEQGRRSGAIIIANQRFRKLFPRG